LTVFRLVKLSIVSKSRSRGACPPKRIWGQQKQLNTYNHRIQAINENEQTYNTDYQYYIKIREFSCHSLPGRYTMCETSVMIRGIKNTHLGSI
jgi:hypothetical protein